MAVTFDSTRRQYLRNIGYVRVGSRSQAKFYLGYDPREAAVRDARLEQVWAGVRGEEGAWDDATLAIAKAVAKGDHSVVLPIPAEFREGEQLTHWLERYRNRFGAIVRILAPDQAAEVDAYQVAERNRTEAKARLDWQYPEFARVATANAPPLAELLTAYQAELMTRAAKSDPSGWKAAQARQVGTLIRLFGEVRLGTRTDVQAVADVLADPTTESVQGKPLAPITRRKLWERFHAALLWAEDERGIQRPRGTERVKLQLARTNEPVVMRQWTVDELRTLWGVSSVLTRAMIALGLNCGWQEADFGDLEDGHLFINKPPHVAGSNVIGRVVHHRPGDSWIVMTRKKTGVPGVHKLWPETVQALAELRDRRDRIVAKTRQRTAKLFIADRTGRPLTEKTGGGNKSSRVSNLWRICLRAAKRVDKGLVQLPVKWLRKASQEYLRLDSPDDIVSIHARSGQVTADTLMKCYASRPWAKVAEATDRLRERLAGVFVDENARDD